MDLQPDQHLNLRPAAAGRVDPGRPAAQCDRLAESLSGLAGLSHARLSLEDLLTEVASSAVQAIPGADGAGLTLLEADRADTVVTTAPFAAVIDGIQYGIGNGPCISAAETGHIMRSHFLGGDRRWPRFGPRASGLGVHSALSLPLLAQGTVLGVINVYAHPQQAFSDHSEHIGQRFAVPAAISVHNAQILAQTQRLTAELQEALTGRAVIDQAIGILMSRIGITADQAFHRLRTLSQAEHIKVAVLATRIVEGAAGRARDRRTRSFGSPPIMR